MKQIPLTMGMVALVDDEDFEALSAFKWQAARNKRGIDLWYAIRSEVVNGKQITIRMHRQIMGHPIGTRIDHRDCNGLNNTRANLRICSASQNGGNMRPRCGKGFKGTRFHGPNQKFQARIMVNRKPISLGYFNEEIDAARAYNAAALKYFGEFARLNNVPAEVGA